MNDGRWGKKRVKTRANRIINVKSDVERGKEFEETDSTDGSECHDLEELFMEVMMIYELVCWIYNPHSIYVF